MYKRLYVVVDMLDHDFKSVDSRNGRLGRRDLGDMDEEEHDLRPARGLPTCATPLSALCREHQGRADFVRLTVRVTILRTDGTNGQVL
jgi:hypothetical protein